jgi:hypothetical protein
MLSCPPNRRRDQDRVGPVHERLVDSIQLIAGIHLRDRTGPGAGVRALGIKTFAMAKIEFAQANQLGFAAARPRLGQGLVQQQLGGAGTRILQVHHRRGNAHHADRTRLVLDGTSQRMRRVRNLFSRGRRCQIHQYDSPLDPNLVDRHAAVANFGTHLARLPVKFPEVPVEQIALAGS